MSQPKEKAAAPTRGVWDKILTVLACLYVGFVILSPFAPDAQLASRAYQINILIMLYMVLALGLNVVIGWIGLLDLGYVGFVLIGVYTTIILTAWLAIEVPCESPHAGVYQRLDAAGNVVNLTSGQRVERGDVLGTVVADGVAHEVLVVVGGKLSGFDVQVGQQVEGGGTVASVQKSAPFIFIPIMIIAALHTMLWGLLRGIPVLRLRDDYFAIVTFAFAEIVFSFVQNETQLTGGPKGFPSEHPPDLIFTQLKQDSLALYFFVALCLFGLVVAMNRLSTSRLGRAWFAIRADETSAQASGIAINRYKMLAFAISALIAGLGGSMMGFQQHVISTNTFDFWLSVIVLCCIVLGGMGSIRGVLIGSAVLMGMGEILRDVLPQIGVDARARMLFYGIVMIGIMIFRARGISPPRIRPESFTPDEAEAMSQEPGKLFALDKHLLETEHRVEAVDD